MIDYIPSNSVKKYIKDNNITLSDFEKAALIYNAHNVTKEDVYAELAELIQETKDKNCWSFCVFVRFIKLFLIF